MTAGRFQPLSLIHNNVMGLDPVPCGTDRPSSLGYLVLTVLSKVLRICVMVPVGSSIEELLAGLLASIPAVYVFCIIELLQDPVVPASLLKDNRAAPVFRMEPSHHISIIHMAFCDIQRPPPQFRDCPILSAFQTIECTLCEHSIVMKKKAPDTAYAVSGAS